MNKNLELNERILNYENRINYQNEEIIKTENVIKKLQKCLSNQNEALKMFTAEKNRLIKEKNQIDSISQPSLKKINSKDKKSKIVSKKRKIDNIISSISPKGSVLSDIDTYLLNNIKEINIPYITKTSVYRILPYGEDIFICGSRGMLLRYTSARTITYSTNTTNVINEIEILVYGKRTSLVGFTKGLVIIFPDIENCAVRRDLPRSVSGKVFNDKDVIYVPIRQGLIEKLDSKDLELSHFTQLKNGDVYNFVPNFEHNKYSLITFKDSVLYKATKTNSRLQNVEIFDDTTSIRNIMRLGAGNFLYYSDHKIWILTATLQRNGVYTFTQEIKFVELCEKALAVVDCDNVLFIYKLADHDCIGERTHYIRIPRNISALSITNENVYLSVGNNILLVDYTKIS